MDDSNVTRSILREMLHRLGAHHILEAANGKSGIDKLCSVAPDVVILDWEMPDLSGGDFLRLVRSPGTFPFPETPIIVVSSHSEQKVVTEAFCAGVNEYLMKPVSPNSLRERLVQVLIYPRPMLQVGAYYGPEPRKSAAILRNQLSEGKDGVVWIE